MKIDLKLTNEDVRSILTEKIHELLPEEVLTEPGSLEIEMFLTGEDSNLVLTEHDITNPEDWSIDVCVYAKDKDDSDEE